MSVDAGSPLAREWAREEIKKLNRLEAADYVCPKCGDGFLQYFKDREECRDCGHVIRVIKQ